MSHHPSRPQPRSIWAALEIDHFAAQAMAALQPALRGTAFVVIQQRGDHHKSAACAVSRQAHDLGVHAGTPIFVLRRRFGRQIRVVRRDVAAEQDRRRVLEAALQRWTPAITLQQKRATMTAVIDLAGTPASRLWDPGQMAGQLQEHILRRCGLEASVGLASSRLAARLVARDRLPDGVAVCEAADEPDLLRRLATDDLPGLAPACRERAALYGLEHVDQILQLDRASLMRRFGRDEGLRLYGLVRGLEAQPRVRPTESLDAETVLEEDVNDEAALRQALHLTVDKACHQLRSTGQVAKGFALRLTYSDLRSRQKSSVLHAPTDDYALLCDTADGLFEMLHTRRVALKSLLIRVNRTTPTTGQGDLFAGVQEARRQRLGRAITDIRQRMGFSAVGTACDRLPTRDPSA